MKTYTFNFEIHAGYGSIIDTREVTININENTPISKIISDARTFYAHDWLEDWCNDNNIDFYEDEGYSLEQLNLSVFS